MSKRRRVLRVVEPDGVGDSGFMRWTKIYFSPTELWKDRDGKKRRKRGKKEKEGRREGRREEEGMRVEEGQTMNIVPSRKGETLRENWLDVDRKKMY